MKIFKGHFFEFIIIKIILLGFEKVVYSILEQIILIDFNLFITIILYFNQIFKFMIILLVIMIIAFKIKRGVIQVKITFIYFILLLHFDFFYQI